MNECLCVYVTVPDEATGRRLAQVLIAEGLAACVNLLPGMLSVYQWEGKVQEDRECLLLAKTSAARAEALTARVRALHPYQCPCITWLPIVGGHADYLAWVLVQTTPSRPASE